MAEVLHSAFQDIIITTPGNFKKSDPSQLHKIFSQYSTPCYLELDLENAWNLAKEIAHPVVICGSFYLVADFIKFQGT